MRLASFKQGGQAGFGIVADHKIVVLSGQDNALPGLRSWLASRAEGQPVPMDGPQLPLDEITLQPPIPDAGKILCVATNFREMQTPDRPFPSHPLVFTRFADTLVGHGSPLLRPPESDSFDFEGEVAVVIGRAGHRIPREAAMNHVAGYACFNDGSVRDWQRHSSQFTPGKNFWQSGAFGPWLVTTDEVPDPALLQMEVRVNGIVRQAIGLDRFIFDIPWLISYLSTFTPLNPGDVIVTGTPSGFGATRRPPEFLVPGDVVEVEVTGLGLLRNPVMQG